MHRFGSDKNCDLFFLHHNYQLFVTDKIPVAKTNGENPDNRFLKKSGLRIFCRELEEVDEVQKQHEAVAAFAPNINNAETIFLRKSAKCALPKMIYMNRNLPPSPVSSE